MKIRATYDKKPMPFRSCDWLAVDDDTYDGPGCPVGTGATEQEAISDLMEQIETHAPACLSGRCFSPNACAVFGYCREKNFGKRA